jgi:hypothetical protein
MMNRRYTSILALLCWLFAGVPCIAQDIAAFECRESIGLAWPRTLVTYQRELPAGRAKPGELRLVDAAGKEQPMQLWQVKTHDDGSLKSARISFYAELARGGSYHYELQPRKPAISSSAPKAQIQNGLITLDNGIVAVRLPAAGKVTFDPPLNMGTDHGQMLDAFGRQAAKGIAPGPIQGIRLSDGRWVGGSYFFASKSDTAPKVTGYTCRIIEEGPLFVETKIRYTLTNSGWYELTARVLADDRAIRIDEQFDMGEPGSMWDYRVMISLTG